VDTLDVVPSLLEEGDQEIEGHHDVFAELELSHLFVTDAGSEASDLLELELDGRTGITNGLGKGLLVSHGGGELTDTVKNGTNNGGNLLEDGIGSHEQSVLLGPLLDDLLVLVELLEGVQVGEINVGEGVLLVLFLVLLIGDNADLEVLTRAVGKADGTHETLVLLGIVVLESNLEFDGLLELAFLDFGLKLNDGLKHLRVGNPVRHYIMY